MLTFQNKGISGTLTCNANNTLPLMADSLTDENALHTITFRERDLGRNR